MTVYNFVALSAASFYGVKLFAKHVIAEKYLKSTDYRQVWLWRNTFCSLVHSFLTAPWTIYCYMKEPRLLNEMISVSTDASTYLVAFSVGYFIYDFADILFHDKLRQWEVICHHITVLTAFNIALSTNHYTGFAVCALLMEFNSIFLHIRRLMKLGGDSQSMLFKIIGILNILSLVFIRICLSGWMIRWLLINKSRLPNFHFIFGFFGMVVMTITNIGLMYRLWISDFKIKAKSIDSKFLKEIKK